MLKKIAIACMLLLPVGLFAQTLKFGHLYSQEIITMMPEVEKANAELQKLQENYVNEIKKSNEELQQKYQEYLNAKDSLPVNIAERRQKEIEDLAQRSEQFQQKAEQDMAKAQNELMTPIYQKLEEAIKAVGQAEGMIYVFDLSRVPIAYVNTAQSTDVTPLVKTKLGLK